MNVCLIVAARMHTLELGNDQAPAMDMPGEIPSMDPEAPSDMDMAPDMSPEEQKMVK